MDFVHGLGHGGDVVLCCAGDALVVDLVCHVCYLSWIFDEREVSVAVLLRGLDDGGLLLLYCFGVYQFKAVWGNI